MERMEAFSLGARRLGGCEVGMVVRNKIMIEAHWWIPIPIFKEGLRSPRYSSVYLHRVS